MDPKELLKNISETSKLAKSLFTILGTYIAFSFATLFSISDVDILFGGYSVELPFVKLNMELAPFFWIGPWIVLILYVAFLNYVVHLRMLIQEYVKCSDCHSEERQSYEQLNKIVYPWTHNIDYVCDLMEECANLSEVGSAKRKRLPNLLVNKTIFRKLLDWFWSFWFWAVPPLTIIFYIYKYSSLQSLWGNLIQSMALFGALIVMIGFSKDTHTKRDRFWVTVVFTAGIIYGVIQFISAGHIIYVDYSDDIYSMRIFSRRLHIDEALLNKTTATRQIIFDPRSYSSENFNGFSSQNNLKIPVAKKRFVGAEFIQMNLSGTNFNRANLSHSKFDVCFSKDISFNNSKMIGAYFLNSYLIGSDFKQTNLNNAHLVQLTATQLEDSMFDGSDFSHGELREVTFGNSTIRNCKFNRTRFWKCNFPEGEIRSNDFNSAILNEVKFENCALVDSRFEFVKLNDSTFLNSKFNRIDLDDSNKNSEGAKDESGGADSEMENNAEPDNRKKPDLNLLKTRNLSFNYAELTNVDFNVVDMDSIPHFIEATLRNVEFKDCYLRGNRFKDASLENVSFSSSILDEVDFSNAKMTNVSFAGAILKEVIVNKENWQQIDLEGAYVVQELWELIELDCKECVENAICVEIEEQGRIWTGKRLDNCGSVKEESLNNA